MHKSELIDHLQKENNCSTDEANNFWNMTVGVIKNITANSQGWSKHFLREHVAANANILVCGYVTTNHEEFSKTCGSAETAKEFAYQLVLSFVNKDANANMNYARREIVLQGMFGKGGKPDSAWQLYTQGFTEAA